MVLVVVPICIIKFVLHERLADFGLGLGNFKLGSALTLVLILVSIPLFCFGSSSESMRVEYPMLYRGLTDAARIQRFNGGSFVL